MFFGVEGIIGRIAITTGCAAVTTAAGWCGYKTVKKVVQKVKARKASDSHAAASGSQNPASEPVRPVATPPGASMSQPAVVPSPVEATMEGTCPNCKKARLAPRVMDDAGTTCLCPLCDHEVHFPRIGSTQAVVQSPVKATMQDFGILQQPEAKPAWGHNLSARELAEIVMQVAREKVDALGADLRKELRAERQANLPETHPAVAHRRLKEERRRQQRQNRVLAGGLSFAGANGNDGM